MILPILAFLTVMAMGVPALAEPAKTYIVGLNADCVPHSKDLSSRLIEVLNATGPGDTLIIYDALKPMMITRISIPANPAYKNSNAKLKRFTDEIGTLTRFLKHRCEKDVVDADAAGQLGLPRFLQELASTVLATPGRSHTSILVVGSALYHGSEIQFSMRDGYFPSDAHLTADFSTTVFSTRGKENNLARIPVHFCYTNPWIHDAHMHWVHRWWAL